MQNEELLIEMEPIKDKSHGIIKVIGVGGGGGNAVRNMYRKGCEGVSYAVCNTDSQALSRTEIPVRIQLGKEGLGVGGDPAKGRAKAEESMKELESLLNDGTQMVFITAGMGGGTGTGAAPVIAQMARERGILTIGVVTIPFAFEKRKRIEKALVGAQELSRQVDALLVINNERLMEIYADGNTTCTEAFEHADDILTVSTRSIAEIITIEGIINRDFCDVKSVMQDGGSAIISIGHGKGEHRILKAVEEALDSPLLTGVDIENAQKMLCIVYTGTKRPVKITEMSEIYDFMDMLNPDLEVFFGLYPDEELDEDVKVSITATGFNSITNMESSKLSADEMTQLLKEHYYGPDKRLSTRKNEPATSVSEPTELTDIQTETTVVSGVVAPAGEDPAGAAPQTAAMTEPEKKREEKNEKNEKTKKTKGRGNWGRYLKEYLVNLVQEDETYSVG